ncbi:myosin-11-like isoform X1 [Coffea eugenioides]|uniref:myosin-11-like isoform X1 n=1 Tax=Coffea eugenioides TaxID=49369 RepID=UPI000F612316|nr:myosin-11-like isoform X1 [Coffea eugenioides]
MFKSARWRSDKNKIKAEFKLQFHATQVSQIGGDGLTISVVPADVGKPTVKLEKATFRDGSCFWDTPFIETVKFVREPKTGKIHERIYHFLIGTASLKAGVVGEASLDLSCYALATKISSVSLPLKNSKSAIVLHVSIQRMLDSVDHREIEESENLKQNSQDRSLKAKLSNGDMEGGIKKHTNDETTLNVKTNHSAELNGNCRASSGSDVTTSSSDSSLGLNTQIQIRPTSDVSEQINEECQKSWEWLGGLVLEESTDDSSGTPREALLREISQEAPDIVVEKLTSELSALARQAKMSELELQTLRKQIVKESRRGQELSRDISKLKEERESFREECEKLKAFQSRLEEAKSRNKMQFEGGDPYAFIEELRQELNYEKDLNNNLRIQLQKTQESNSELILAVRDLDEMLEQKNKETSRLPNKSAALDSAKMLQEATYGREIDDDDEEQRALEELVKEHTGSREAHMLEQKIVDLQSEIDICRREKEEIEMQMEQLALDYEILKQENHDISYKLEQSQLQEQLKMQYECTSSYASVNELEAQIESLENELNKTSQDFSDALNTISELEGQVKTLENELKEQSHEHSDTFISISELEAQVKTLVNELKEQSDAHADALVTISELQGQVMSLENEIKGQSTEHSDALNSVSELEDQLKNLEEELEKQAQVYEADMEALTSAKVEQEQRAIRAEESLRKMRWQNASTAERLQEEFRKLSVQMASTFEANENLAAKALTEANELRLQKSHLEEKLHNGSEELQLVSHHYEARLHELSNKVISMSNHMEELQSEIQDKSVQLEDQVKSAEEIQLHLMQEIQMLKSEISTLAMENKNLSDQAEERESLRFEIENMRRSCKELELLLLQANNERAELESKVALAKDKEELSLKELHSMRYLKDEKESTTKNLQIEVDNFKLQCEELKQTLSEDALEKEKLKKQVLQLKGDLKRKEDAFNSMEKKIKDSNGRVTASDGTKATSKNNKFQNASRTPKEVASLKEKVKLLEGQIKLRETALEKSTSSFLEKEKDLQNKIEELEQRLEVLNHNTTSFCQENCYKISEAPKDLTLDSRLAEEVMDATGRQSTDACIPEENSAPSSRKSSHDDLTQNDVKSCASDSRVEELLSELTSLKERNSMMEVELKEMQERYSEISLKFAEVEGERQQLVMRVRNLKSAKRNP